MRWLIVNFETWIELTSYRVSPIFNLTAPLLYTCILPIYPLGSSNKLLAFFTFADTFEVPIFSFPLLFTGLTQGRTVGSLKKINCGCSLLS